MIHCLLMHTDHRQRAQHISRHGLGLLLLLPGLTHRAVVCLVDKVCGGGALGGVRVLQ